MDYSRFRKLFESSNSLVQRLAAFSTRLRGFLGEIWGFEGELGDGGMLRKSSYTAEF